ncbi:response regulator transcription factor [Ancylomarina longa]|uniref:DNA-binding response regulator n=1 Tax=Ancylomarina longa TaxID=2487017 RepID=A0A434AVF1_9BACT|nr:response regulator transcription factor [Ancylomarina longa]RUT78334.1 DNA-binding response regulator [Ancylomarina longa]
MEDYKIIIVDDHRIFRKGLRFLLDDMEGINVVGEAENGKEFLTLLKITSADIILMDINMPEMDGIEATIKALDRFPELKIIVLSMHGEEQYYDKMVEAGAKGFLLKNSDVDELSKALHTIGAGGTYFSQELLVGILNKRKQQKHPSEVIQFTDRELEVLQLICKGHNNNKIAEELFISIRTVERHRANLLSKTNCSNSIAMVMYAVKNNIIEI